MIANFSVLHFERGLCPRNRILGGGFGRGAKPPSEWPSRRIGRHAGDHRARGPRERGGALHGKERDTLRAHLGRAALDPEAASSTTGGREVALALPTGSVLRPGAVVLVEADWYLAVEGCPEPVLAVAPRNWAEAVRIAFDVGNRHFPLALDGECLLVPDDSAMEQLLSRLGARWERRQAVFDPVGSGHRHADGTSAIDGHRASELASRP